MDSTQMERRKMVTIPQEELEAILERAAERGARHALADVGLDGPEAAHDIELAKRFEGFERKLKRATEITATPYICPAGFWTIGYGHLCGPKHPPITEEEAGIHLARDLQTALVATLRFCPVLATEPEGRLAAIVDFTFNLGAGRLQTSTLRRRVNQRDWISSGVELQRWIYGSGKVLPGLVSRRRAEASLLLNPENPARER